MGKNKNQNKLKKYLDKIEEIYYIKNMKDMKAFNERIKRLQEKLSFYQDGNSKVSNERIRQYSIDLFKKLIHEAMAERSKLVGLK
jgi:hypothetical protein